MLRGEVWTVDLGNTIGSEQNGFRPCVIVQNNIGNEKSVTTIILPITKQNKHYAATHVKVELKESSIVLGEQIRVVDKSRLKNYITTLTYKQMLQIDEKLKLTLSL